MSLIVILFWWSVCRSFRDLQPTTIDRSQPNLDPCKPFWIPCLPYFGCQREKYAKFRLFPTRILATANVMHRAIWLVAWLSVLTDSVRIPKNTNRLGYSSRGGWECYRGDQSSSSLPSLGWDWPVHSRSHRLYTHNTVWLPIYSQKQISRAQVYVPVDTKQAISEKFLPANLLASSTTTHAHKYDLHHNHNMMRYNEIY